jgi:two-component system KDP operon response regulator KdpE
VSDDWLLAGSVAVSLSRHEVRRRGKTVHLTPTEYLVLEALAATPREAVSHRELTRRLWRPEPASARHSLRVYIRQLREKLEETPSAPTVILTVPGGGYCLNASVIADQARESG